MTLTFVESDKNRFYFHSNQLYTPEIPIDVELGESSRLFCKVFDLAVAGAPISLFSSDPFILRYSSVEFQHLGREETYCLFEITPKQFYIETQSESSPLESGEIEMRCFVHPLFDSEEKEIISMRGFLPLRFQIHVHVLIIF